MNIQHKIEQIRRKPEHIRQRYVWGLVAVSMAIILIIWIFSLSVELKNNAASPEIQSEISSQQQTLKSQAEELKNIGSEMKNNLEQLKNQ
ncbi:MAG: hypothetical protein NTZ97_04575 [Candidatus Moranbacteria bacterium]|nr:hypothetical protein [Candidatus Moranbacteria bacterium]